MPWESNLESPVVWPGNEGWRDAETDAYDNHTLDVHASGSGSYSRCPGCACFQRELGTERNPPAVVDPYNSRQHAVVDQVAHGCRADSQATGSCGNTHGTLQVAPQVLD
jgi:hypothetical protein